MNWLKRLIKSKISITIVHSVEGVEHRFSPVKKEKKDSPLIKRSKHSTYRFIQKNVKELSGKTRVYYFSERWDGKGWEYLSDTFEADKNKAMDIYCKLVGGEEIEREEKVETVLWEGLSKEEAEMWTALHRT